MSVRPGKMHEGLIEELEEMARKENRTLNSYTCHILSNHIKNVKTNGQNAGSVDGGQTPSQNS